MRFSKKRLVAISLITLLILLPISFAVEHNQFVGQYDIEYDDNGNIIEDNQHHYEYDGFNQLARIRVDNSSGDVLVEYSYDQDGRRIKKIVYTDNGPVTTYYIDENFLKVVNSSGEYEEVYYYAANQLVGKKDSDGSLNFFHSDHLGSTDLVTDENGEKVSETKYMPFGEVLLGGESRFGFTGQEDDKEADLMYYGARYYDPSLRRFTQPDMVIMDVYDPQNLNRYAYALNNPLKYTDPTGHFACFGLCIGALMALTYLMTYVASTASIWGPPLQAYVVTQASEDIDTARSNPTFTNLAFAGLGIYDSLSPGIPEGKIGRGMLSAGRKGFTKVNSFLRHSDEVKKIPISKLYGHETTLPADLFRKGAKTHNNIPIDVTQYGDKYIINDGVGRSMRAQANGEKFVYAKVSRGAYSSVDDLKVMASVGDVFAKSELKYFTNPYLKIDSNERALRLMFSPWI